MRRDACDLITNRGFPGDVCATALMRASADAGLCLDVQEMAHVGLNLSALACFGPVTALNLQLWPWSVLALTALTCRCLALAHDDLCLECGFVQLRPWSNLSDKQ